ACPTGYSSRPGTQMILRWPKGSASGQSQPGRTDSKSAVVRYGPIAFGTRSATKDAMCQLQRSASGRLLEPPQRKNKNSVPPAEFVTLGASKQEPLRERASYFL